MRRSRSRRRSVAMRCPVCMFKPASRRGVLCVECRAEFKELAAEWAGVA